MSKKAKIVVSVKWETFVEVETEIVDDEYNFKEICELARIKWQDRDFVDDFDLEFDIV